MLGGGWCRGGRWLHRVKVQTTQANTKRNLKIILGDDARKQSFSTLLRKEIIRPILNLNCEELAYSRSIYHGAEFHENFNLARDVVQPLAEARGEKACLIFRDGQSRREEVSYSELFSSCVQLSSGLRDHCSRHYGSGPPSLALVIVPKIPAWWVINIAGYWCGFTVSPGTSLLRAKDLQYRLSESGADCVFCGPDLVPGMNQAHTKLGKKLLKVVVGSPASFDVSGWVRYEDLLLAGQGLPPTHCHENKSDDICQLFFTSGTTGNPKMVPHTHDSYARGMQTTARSWLDMTEDDVLYNVSDTGWAKAAWSSLYVPLIAGATAFVHQVERFEPSLLLKALQEEPVSVMCAPPTAYRALVQMPLQDYSFRKLRHCVSAGEPLNPEVRETWLAKTGIDLYEGYGQSETTLLCATMRGMDVKPGSMGKPAPGYHIRVLDNNFKELPDGEEGQIAVETTPVYPDGLLKGYHADDARTESVFREGHYVTGDRGYKDQDGYFWFVARDDDVINSAGYRIGPFEVESALLEHIAVAESAVVGAPDPLRGHIVKAFVVLSTEAAARILGNSSEEENLKKELQSHVKTATAPYKYPRLIEFVSCLPKTISGKIRRVELKQQSTNKTAGGGN